MERAFVYEAPKGASPSSLDSKECALPLPRSDITQQPTVSAITFIPTMPERTTSVGSITSFETEPMSASPQPHDHYLDDAIIAMTTRFDTLNDRVTQLDKELTFKADQALLGATQVSKDVSALNDTMTQLGLDLNLKADETLQGLTQVISEVSASQKHLERVVKSENDDLLADFRRLLQGREESHAPGPTVHSP